VTTLGERLVELTSELVRIDSRNPWLIDGGPGEAKIGTVLADLAAGLPRVEVAVEEVEAGRPNVLARLSGSGGRVGGRRSVSTPTWIRSATLRGPIVR
jgi:acetylornithine deacetylase/succinyl-diaminopimelate desuccinylase-like protein